MITSSRIKTLELLADATEDMHLRAAAHRARADLLVQLALEQPTKEDEAEEHRLAAEARDAEQNERNRAHNQRVQIVTEIPRPS